MLDMVKKEHFLNKLLLISIIFVFVIWIRCQLVNMIRINFGLTLGSIILTGIVFLFIYKIIKKINIKNKYIEILLIILIISMGLGLRILANNIMKTLPVSDFGTPHYVSQNQDVLFGNSENIQNLNSIQLYYSRFPAWFPYMKVVSGIYSLFGFNLLYIKIFNWILYVITGLFIYQIGKKEVSYKSGLMSLIVFSFFPSLIVYSNITTPDHITIMLFVILIWIYQNLIKSRDVGDKKSIIIYSLLNIFIVCIINMFKPTLILGILVFIFTEIICYIYPVIFNGEKRKLYIRNVLKYVCIYLILFLLSINFSGKLLNKYVEKNIYTDVVNSTGLYMLWAYAIDEYGNYNPDIGSNIFLDLMKKHENNQKEVMDEINVLAKKQFINNIRYFPRIIKQKTVILFANDNDIFSFANYSNNEKYQDLVNDKYKSFYTFSSGSFIIILLIFCIYTVIKDFKENINNKIITVMVLLIMGYISMLLLGGIQSRYKILLYGVLSLLAFMQLNLKNKEN